MCRPAAAADQFAVTRGLICACQKSAASRSPALNCGSVIMLAVLVLALPQPRAGSPARALGRQLALAARLPAAPVARCAF
jgi:hypothetical protein